MRNILFKLGIVYVFVMFISGSAFAVENTAVPSDPSAFDKWTRHTVADTRVSLECWGDFKGPKNAQVLYNLLDQTVLDSMVIKKFYDLSGIIEYSSFPVRVLYMKSKNVINLEKMKALIPLNEGENLTSQKTNISGIGGFMDRITSKTSSVWALYLSKGNEFWWIESECFTDPKIDKIISRLFSTVQITK